MSFWVPLRVHSQYSILDANAITGTANKDYACKEECDPRNSNKEKGKLIFQDLIKKLCAELNELIQ